MRVIDQLRAVIAQTAGCAMVVLAIKVSHRRDGSLLATNARPLHSGWAELSSTSRLANIGTGSRGGPLLSMIVGSLARIARAPIETLPVI
ncbi:hypothetical protein Thiosp_01058 [Thiorhodovibrio litoralis]|nr:hypothetical protein Thiosp_01058 [Thiorhodovibrio litoralis]